MQTKINRFLSFALILCMASALLPAFPLSASAEPAAKIFVDNGKELNASNPFLVDGEPASAGPLNGTTCTAQFDPATGTLTLHNYNGGVINTEYKSDAPIVDIMIKLVGVNTITGGGTGTTYVHGIFNAHGYGATPGGLITITAEDIASLSINMSSAGTGVIVNGISGKVSQRVNDGGVIISGKADVSITAVGASSVFGIRTAEQYATPPVDDKVSILDDAS